MISHNHRQLNLQQTRRSLAAHLHLELRLCLVGP